MFLNISQSLREHFANNFPNGCPVTPTPIVIYPNRRPDKLPNDKIYLEFHSPIIGSQQQQSQVNGSTFGHGVAGIDILIPKNQGIYIGYRIADHIEGFMNHVFITNNDVRIWLHSIRMTELPTIKENQFLCLRTEIEFNNYNC